METELLEAKPNLATSAFKVAYVEEIFSDKDEITAELVRGAARGVEKPRMMLIADQNFVQNNPGIGSAIGRYLKKHDISLLGVPVTAKRAKEPRNDSMQMALALGRSMAEAGLKAEDALMILGGGALLDIAGFAASMIYNGVQNIVRVPTTLGSMVECSCTDRVSLDTYSTCCAYTIPSVPYASVVSPKLNATAFDGVWKGGAGTMIRYAAVRDSALMKKLMKEGHYIRERNIEKTGALLRQLLVSRAKKSDSDFALWCANRLWSMSGAKIPYGYACGIGLCIDCAYAVAQGVLDPEAQEGICRAAADSGALDGLLHSYHIMSQTDSIITGLEEWRTQRGSYARTVPTGYGKETHIESADKAVYKKIIKDFISAYSGK